jgi:ELWxxDGT repeat protein
VLVKDLTTGLDIDFVVPVDTKVVNNTLYFKVINSTGDWHDEIWKSNGDPAGTQPIKIFDPGNYTYSFGGSNGTLYFDLYNSTYGRELWKSDGTETGTQMVADLYPGPISSNPYFLTDFNGKLLFSASNVINGNELWTTDGSETGVSLVKDINTTSTNSSYAGSNYFFKGIAASANGVVFNAITYALGAELYKSDGTSAGTALLNDIATGPDGSYPNNFLFKNNVNYFIGDNAIGTALYKTNGTTAGLQRITAYINRDIYYVVNYNVADNGLAFYTLGYRSSGAQELWRSDGTDGGTYMLTPNLSYYYNNYVATVGNTAFFIAGDDVHGYELWKSDGTIAGTKMVKDISPGFGGSDPYNLFVYKKDVYFGAYDGGLNFALWKSDGTEKGTIKLKSITPALYYSYFNTTPQHVFCVSNNILYFTATDFNAFGAELWKTNGTVAGTTLVKDINPYFSSNPDNLTDVKGTLYFTADDGVHGNEIWKTNVTSQSTQMVKDITPDYIYGYYTNFAVQVVNYIF